MMDGVLANRGQDNSYKGRLIVAAVGVMLVTGCGGDASDMLAPSDSLSLCAPACADPAPLQGRWNQRLPTGYIVLFHDGVDVAEETARLAASYGFTPKYVYTIIPAFAAELTCGALAGIRCEPTVERVSYDELVHATP